jgi:lipopolysaccharide transport system ATP-binding protein
MSQTILRVENVSKFYKLGILGSGSLKKDLQNWWRTKALKQTILSPIEKKESKDYIWALNDINFEINEGDCLGIVGKNGSGKSTLLKTISRIVPPTTGSIKGRGKITSLLEVGTGFHPELSGRENLYLNGQILGMGKKEITSKLDEIIDFSGVERFLDTPVKRYSSGMYVRLAFSVAAHLNTDILIVDEVLAVGDSEFQKKCIGKMQDVTQKRGKTILFVSHNLLALGNLCNKAICLSKGNLVDFGDSKSVISNYLNKEKVEILEQNFDLSETKVGNGNVEMHSISLKPQYNNFNIIDTSTALVINFSFLNKIKGSNKISVNVLLYYFGGDCVFETGSIPMVHAEGNLNGSCLIPGNFLNDGHYYISLVFLKNSSEVIFEFSEALVFDVADYREDTSSFRKWKGAVRPHFPVLLEQSVV